MHPELEAILYRARADRLSGAAALAAGVCNSLVPFCERMRGQAVKDDLDGFAVALVRAQPNMGSAWSIANGILHRSPDIASVAAFCASTSTHLAEAPGRIAEFAAREVSGRRAITTSSSSAVFHTLLRASSSPGTSAVVCESRPLREGVLMARELGHMGVKVTVIADAALALFSSEASVALVGADAINKDGVIAKIGIAHLAMACESRNMPLLVLADSTKFAPVRLTRDPRDPSELLEPGVIGVSAENRCFEQLPFERVTALFSEKGRLSPDDARRAVWGVKAHPKLQERAQ